MRAVLPDKRELVELSTLTVFPGARAQDWHPDVQGDVVSIFIPMYPTSEGVGALEVIPGSHKRATPPPEEMRERDGRAVQLDAGCAVAMQASLWHRGGANRSIDRVRPVFYASFGNPDLEGPTYSILEQERGRYDLEEFVRSEGGRRYNWSLDARPGIAPGMTVTQSMNGETLYLVGPGGIVDGFACGPKAGWIRSFLRQCAHDGPVASISEIAAEAGKEPADVLRVVSSLAHDDWLRH